MKKIYSLEIDTDLREAIREVARKRAAEYSKPVTMKDIILSCIMTDRDIVAEYAKRKQGGKK